MFGINGGEFIVLLIVAAVVIGPERLPGYAEQLAGFVRSARTMLTSAKTRVDSEFSEELGDVDWSSLDPRRYDPRRIVRDALMEDEGLGLGAIIGSQGLNRDAGSGKSAAAQRNAQPTSGAAATDVAHPPVEGEQPESDAPLAFDDEAT